MMDAFAASLDLRMICLPLLSTSILMLEMDVKASGEYVTSARSVSPESAEFLSVRTSTTAWCIDDRNSSGLTAFSNVAKKLIVSLINVHPF